MPTMRVLWEIDVEVPDEGTAQEQAIAAARLARECQNEGTTALVFLVKPFDEVEERDFSDWYGVDLDEPEEVEMVMDLVEHDEEECP